MIATLKGALKGAALGVVLGLVAAVMVRCYGNERAEAAKRAVSRAAFVQVIEKTDTLWRTRVVTVTPRIEEAIDSAEARGDTATKETLLQCRDLIPACEVRVAARDSLIAELRRPGPRLSFYGDVLYRIPVMRSDTGARIVVRGGADVRLTDRWSALVEADATSRAIQAGVRWRF